MVTPDSLHHQPSHTYSIKIRYTNGYTHGIDYSEQILTTSSCLDACFVDQQNANDDLRWLVKCKT